MIVLLYALSLSLSLSLIYHRHTLLGYTHSHLQMGRIRVGIHQRFYGWDPTPKRCRHQRRGLAAPLRPTCSNPAHTLRLNERLELPHVRRSAILIAPAENRIGAVEFRLIH